jgi:hypothetical protein
MRNTVTDRPWDRYTLDPLEQLRVQKDARGVAWRSSASSIATPTTQPRPSQFDTEHAWPFYISIVAADAQGKLAEARAWRLDDGGKVFREEPLTVS